MRIERKIVHMHLDAGLPCERVPLSGSAGGSFSGDLVIGNLRAEVKGRKNGEGFKSIIDWLDTNDLLFLVKDHREPMVVMNFSQYERFMLLEQRLNKPTDYGVKLIPIDASCQSDHES